MYSADNYIYNGVTVTVRPSRTVYIVPQNIKQLELDSTLSLPGYAADAKVVGEALKGKLDIPEKTDDAYRVAIVDKDGNVTWQVPQRVGSIANRVVMTTESGNIVVPPTPLNPQNATSKQYVDNLADTKLDKVTDASARIKVYGVNFDGQQQMIDTPNVSGDVWQGRLAKYLVNTASADTVPDAVLVTGTPKKPAHATTKKYVDDKFNGANKAVSFNNYEEMISALNTASATTYQTGQNIMIVTLEVPDLWVSEIALEGENVAYEYVDDATFVDELSHGTVQVGYFYLSALETQKVDLTEYAKTDDINVELEGKLDKPTTPSSFSVIAMQNNGTVDTRTIAATPSLVAQNRIPMYLNTANNDVPAAGAHLFVATPTRPGHTANKKYVDDAVAAGGSSGGAPVKLVYVPFYDYGGELIFYSSKTFNNLREIWTFFNQYNNVAPGIAYQPFPAIWNGDDAATGINKQEIGVMTFSAQETGNEDDVFFLNGQEVTVTELEDSFTGIYYYDI